MTSRKQNSHGANLITLPEFLTLVTSLILGLLLQEAIFFYNTRDWVKSHGTVEAVTVKGETWVEEGLTQNRSWREGTYLYQLDDRVFRGYRFELVPLLENTRAPRKYLPKGRELPGSEIDIYVDPEGRYGSYAQEGNTKWQKWAYYACCVTVAVLAVSLLATLRAGLKSFAGSFLLSLLLFGGAYAFSYNPDRVLEPDEILETRELYDLLVYIGQYAYLGPKPDDLKVLKEGMTIDKAAELVGRPNYLNVNSNRIWWAFDGTGWTVHPALIFEKKNGEYRLAKVNRP